MKRIIPLFIVFLFTLSSCNSFFQIEKRHYRKGFYVHHNNSDLNTFLADTFSKAPVKNQAEKKTLTVENHKEHLTIRKSAAPARQSKLIKTIKAKTVQLTSAKKSVHLISANKKVNKEADNTDDNRFTKITRILGIAAIVLIIVGLFLVEFTAAGLPLIVIGFFCGLFGIEFGRKALNYAPKIRKDTPITDSKLNEDRKKAKRAYLLNLCAILFLFAYILFRFGFIAVSSSIGLAVLLFALLLILFITFKLGWYRGLGN